MVGGQVLKGLRMIDGDKPSPSTQIQTAQYEEDEKLLVNIQGSS